ncbi:MAG: alpha-L-fucosidase [Oscillospiraceae bacterium]|nr:alpha-L-fucosidase [Oscillospiraceae bacterium]
MKVNMHLQPSQIDEAVTMDNRLKHFESRNRPEKLEWLRDAGFGMFIHWSLDSQLGCVISHSLVGASQDYIERYYSLLPKTLNPDRWDFDRLASLAKLCGMEYAVLTTKHHNGFCLWDTDSTDCNIMNTSYGKDLVKQYADAFRKAGVKVGFYFSPEDFYYLKNAGMPITRTPTEPYPKEVMDGYRALLTKQMTELMTRFGTVDVMFFDGGETMRDENGESLQELCMNIAWDHNPDLLITRGAIPTPEQQLPGVGADMAWEACITLGTAWQYQPTNETYKTGLHAIRILTETRAKGGSLLLNIGPDASGELCREQENILREIALWQFINGEALRESRPWILTNEDNIWLLKHKSGNAVYAVLFGEEDWDRGTRREFVIRSVRANENTRVEVLGHGGEFIEYRPDLDVKVYWEQKENGLYISAFNAQRIYCGINWRNPLVLKITDASPAFVPMEVQTGDFRQEKDLAFLTADVHSLGSFDAAEVTVEWRVYPGFALSSYETGWKTADAVTVTSPGRTEICLSGLEKGVTYQYRAVISNNMNRMSGEKLLFTPV